MQEDNYETSASRFWQVFESTGNIEYYLKYKQAYNFNAEVTNAAGSKGNSSARG